MESTKKDLFLKERVKELKIGKEFVRAEIVAEGTQRDKLNPELASEKTDLEKPRLTLVGKTDFMELLKGHIADQETSFALGQRGLKAKLAEAAEIHSEALKKMDAHREHRRDKVDQLHFLRVTLDFEVRTTEQKQTGCKFCVLDSSGTGSGA